MNDDSTKEMNGARPLLERILVRLDAMDEHLKVLDDIKSRLEILEEKAERVAMSTKPIWEQALAAIAETRQELAEFRKETNDNQRATNRKLDILNNEILNMKADQLDANARI